jgi:hypothetical protein
MSKRLLVVIWLLPLLVSAQQKEKTDVWKPLRFLEGIWEGRGDGMNGISSVTQEYRFILNGKFLRMTTKSVFKPQEKNPEGEVHEDIGIFSYDGSREKFILRGFYVEGFVNQYVGEHISEDGNTLTFLTEHIENAPPGTKAKLIFQKISETELEQSFFVAWPEREFSCFSVNTLKRKK